MQETLPRIDRRRSYPTDVSVHGLTVVTRNVADSKPFGVPLLNPFKA